MSAQEREEQALARLRAADPAATSALPSLAAVEARLRHRLETLDDTGASHLEEADGADPEGAGEADADATDHPGSSSASAGSRPREVADSTGDLQRRVVPLDDARRRRSTRPAGAWLAAAAAVAVAAGGGGYLLGSGGLNSSDSPTTASESAVTEESGADAAEGESGGDAESGESGGDAESGESGGDAESADSGDEAVSGAPTDEAAGDQRAGAAPGQGAETPESGLPEADAMTSGPDTDHSPETATAASTFASDLGVTPPADYSWAGPPLDTVTAETLDPPADVEEVVALAPLVTTPEEFAEVADRLDLTVSDEQDGTVTQFAAGPDGDLGLDPRGGLTLTLNRDAATPVADSASAVAVAEDLVGDLGEQSERLQWSATEAAEDTWQVTATYEGVDLPPADAQPWSLTVAPADDEGRVQVLGSGQLRGVESLGPQPLVDVEIALARLNDPRFATGAENSLTPTDTPDDAASDSPVPWQAPEVELVDAGLVVGRYVSPSGVTYRAPVYQFQTEGGMPVDVIALEDEVLGLD